MRSGNPAARHADPVNFHATGSDDEEGEEFDLVKVMNEMKVHERRKVYALKGLLDEYKAVRRQFRDELGLLQIEHLQAAQKLYDIRTSIVCGQRDITDDELAAAGAKEVGASGVCEIPSSDGEDDTEKNKKAKKSVRVITPSEACDPLEAAAGKPDGGIPNFWLTAMCNTEALDSMITERDRHALSYLRDIKLEHVEGDPQKGVQIDFYFAPNEYFKNTVLSKTYRMVFDEDSGEMEIDSMKATPVEWLSPEKNLTIVIKKKKQRHKSSKSIRVVTREENCPSFFNLFKNPLGDEDDEDDNKNEEDDDDEEEMAELHIEAGQVLMEEIVPKAAFYYTGKSVEQAALALKEKFGSHFDTDTDEDDDDEDENEDDGDGNIGTNIKFIAQKKGPREITGGSSNNGNKKDAKECKQQ
ncbi:putative Nucleosome assembly protein (NAP) [Trypanosoma vivax]|uniref:Putative nucleosome assembly protein-like protein n=1 Tax=Trypanosoma vivax (strain Y486) TaxID=1055687 RepID=G0U283_TRYVY|nr:putative nucleosome assembly protein-like protein [Trypanosoma vivax]KAH8611563.1 putative Nucleosome assembly protein (NAP) [Trypanosoma vivax]KAH8620825.1 putative Nucleosome assembly protein (NAP) [Trypanosoma vivax]CCC50386.1 putative nucleosome assembly protein-like protein [Trypanosoma vivax Y486]